MSAFSSLPGQWRGVSAQGMRIVTSNDDVEGGERGAGHYGCDDCLRICGQPVGGTIFGRLLGAPQH